jgi:hypothetical protein
MSDPEPAAVGFFFEEGVQAALLKRGFSPSDIVIGPWAWQLIDGSVSSFGWVLVLRDGRRAYVEYTVDGACQSGPENVMVAPLAAGEERPVLSDPGVHWFEPRHVNRWLWRRAEDGRAKH